MGFGQRVILKDKAVSQLFSVSKIERKKNVKGWNDVKSTKIIHLSPLLKIYVLFVGHGAKYLGL